MSIQFLDDIMGDAEFLSSVDTSSLESSLSGFNFLEDWLEMYRLSSSSLFLADLTDRRLGFAVTDFL